MISSEVEHFILFYCDRLHDHHSVQPVVIYGLLGLISFQAVADPMVVKLLQSIFAEVCLVYHKLSFLNYKKSTQRFNIYHYKLAESNCFKKYDQRKFSFQKIKVYDS